MKILILAMLLSSVAHAESKAIYTSELPSKQVTKKEAFRRLLVDKGAVVFKCQEQQVSDKGTMINKKYQ